MNPQILERLTARTKALLVALVLGLALSLGLQAWVAAAPAEAYPKNVCTHGTRIHYGPEGRAHAVVFRYDWYTPVGWKMHKMSHYTRYTAPGGAKWILDWTRSYSGCHDTVNA